MINNYDSFDACYSTGSTTSQKQGNASYTAKKRTWLSFVTVFVALFSFVFAQGQSLSNYTFATAATGTLQDLTSGSTSYLSGNNDDAAGTLRPIGFNFNFMGGSYTHFSANSNGQMQLHANSTAAAIGTNVSTSSGAAILAPFTGDNEVNNGLQYKVIGAAPNRTFILQWNQFYVNFVDLSNAGNMQVWLEETTGKITYIYGSIYNSSTASQSRSISIASSNTATTVASITIGATPTFTVGSTLVSNTIAAGSNPVGVTPIVNIGSANDGSRRFFTFTPSTAAVAPPINLTFTALTSAGTTVNWIDDSTNEFGFLVTRATDAAFTTGVATAIVASTTASAVGGAYSSTQTGLLANTTYYYKVQALTEAIFSSELAGSQATNAPGMFISVLTGNFSNATTWDANAIPTPNDNITVSTGNVVTLEAAGLVSNNVIVNGTLVYGTTPASFQINGNLTVNTGGLVNVFFTTTGKALNVKGDIVNNGRIDLSVSSSATATTQGNLNLNGSVVQTVSGTGVFGGTVTATDATNRVGVITHLSFANTSTAIPNIIWSVNNVRLMNGLNTTTAKIALGSNKIIIGNYAAAGGTLTMPVNTGFVSGSVGRWYTTTSTGTGITAGALSTGGASRFPFLTTTGATRAMYISRAGSTTGNVAGEISVVYNDATTTTTGLSILDGTYVVTDRYDGNWAISVGPGYAHVGTHTIELQGYGTFTTLTGNTRVLLASAPADGVHQNGNSAAPSSQRTGITTAQLIANSTYYIGINASDIPFVSITNGNWNVASTWNKGIVPSCADAVVIAAGTTVTMNSIGNVCSNVTIASTANLNVVSGDLSVGCTLFNNPFTNNGTLTVSGGTLNINGNLKHNTGSTFNQSGGEIFVDGNDGTTANSVLTGTPIVSITAAAVSNLNLTGGTLTIVNPHKGTSTSDYALSISQGGAANAASTNHTVVFGNGVATIAGGHANGFYVYLFPGSFYYSLGNVTVDALAGTNRYVKTTSNIGILGNLNIISGEYWSGSSLTYVAGNITNNGILSATSTFGLGTWTNGTFTASANPQIISGTGVFRNLQTAATANLTSLTFNNTNTTGVTLNVPLSVSGTLTLTSGLINTTDTNLLTLGTLTAGGTLSGTPSATNMVKGPFARTIANANANTNYILYPVGKTAYSPIWLAPATTSVTVMQAEALEVNAGTANASIVNLSATRRWEAPIVSGTFTDLNVRLGDATILATSIPVQAATGSGEYTNTFGSVATAVAGTTTQSNTAVSFANYTGYLSFANSNACLGTPAPGTTIASSNSICLGTVVTLSLQNITPGTGVTYQWKSSVDGIAYTDVIGATNTTLIVTPTESLYYKCDVTCAAGPATGSSTAVHITFSNSVTATTPATRCGTGTLILGATPNAGASVNWYSTLIGGAALGTGTSFTTPSITATTTYYAAAAAFSPGALALGLGATTSSSAGSSLLPGGWGGAKTQYIIKASELILAGLGAGDITSLGFETTNSGQTYQGFNVYIGSTTNTTAPTATFVDNAALTKVFAGTLADEGFTPDANALNTLSFGTGAGTSSSFNWDGVSNIVVSISWSRVPAAATSTGTTMKVDNVGFVSTAYRQSDNLAPADMLAATAVTSTTSNRPRFTINGQLVCQSARVPVVATVTTPPVLTLSSSAVTICNGASSGAITVTSTATDFDSYVWTPSAGVTGNSTTGWVFNPAVTTTYSLLASQTAGSLCANTAVITINVNPLPTALSFTPAVPAVCVNNILPLSINGGTLGFVGKVGVGTLTNTTSTPFKGWYGGSKTQALYTAAELSALGMTAGQKISSIGYVALSGAPLVLNNFTINAGFVSNATLGSAFISGATNVVLAPVNYTPTTGTGNLDFALTTPLAWDGVSNLLVETCFNNNNGGGVSTNSISVQSSTVATGLNLYRSQDSTVDVCSNATAPSSSTNRPNLRISTLEATDIFWSPLTNLYSDAAATIPLTAFANAPIVYVKSATAGTVTYTVTATAATGCTRTATVDVVVNALPTVATVNPAAVCFPSTVNLTASAVTVGSDTGLVYTYWTNASATTALTTASAVTTSGTYYIKGTNANGCSVVTPVTVTVNPLPVLSITNPATVCFPATVDLTLPPVTSGSDSVGFSLSYYSDASATVALVAPAVVTTSGTYYIKLTNNTTGCEKIMPVVVTINVTTTPTGTAAQAFCGSANLSQLTVTGSNVKWYNAATAGTEYPASLWPIVGLVNATTYYASQTVNGCESVDRLAVTVTINAIPSAPNAVAQTFCGSATVADLAPTGSTLKWYDVATAGTELSSTTALATGTYYVSQTSTTCEGPRTAVAVTVNVTAAPTASAQTFCGPVTVASLVASGTAIKWYSVATGGTALAASTTLSTGNYFVSQTLNGCEGSRLQVAVTVNSVATPTGAAVQDSCSGTIADFIVTGDSGAVFTWYATSTSTVAIPTTTTAVVNTFYYVSQTVNGCESPRLLVVASGPCLGNEGFDLAKFSYYPNPTNDFVNVTYSDEITQVKVFNMLGQQVSERKVNATTTQVDMSKLASGTYFLEVTSNEVSKTVKVIKN